MDCSPWRTGKYELVDDTRDLFIERTATQQIETDRHTGDFTKFLVTWTSECTYQLYFLEGAEHYLEAWEDNFLEVLILGGDETGYSYQARFSNSDKIENYEIKRVME